MSQPASTAFNFKSPCRWLKKPMIDVAFFNFALNLGIRIIGFLSHIQGDLKAKAVEAGCDTVMPRSAFSQNLPNLLRRHGVDEEEEMEFAQA